MIPLRGLSLFVQVEERTDSRSSLLFARPQVYGCTIPVVPADPPVIIFANDEGVILEVDLSLTVARDERILLLPMLNLFEYLPSPSCDNETTWKKCVADLRRSLLQRDGQTMTSAI